MAQHTAALRDAEAVAKSVQVAASENSMCKVLSLDFDLDEEPQSRLRPQVTWQNLPDTVRATCLEFQLERSATY